MYAKHEKCTADESKVAAEDNGGGEDENMEVDEIVIIPDDFMGRSFLKKACKVLKESRCCLMYSCVYAYNLTFKTAKSTFRENMVTCSLLLKIFVSFWKKMSKNCLTTRKVGR